MTTTMNLTGHRALIVAALALVGFAPALFVHAAAVAQITATPTTIASGEYSTLTWNCYGASANIDQGVGPVASSGSYNVSPVTTKTYTLSCSTGGSIAQAPVTITVTNQGCYQDAEPIVQGNSIIPQYDDSLQGGNIIFNEEGTNALNGGGSFDNQNHYQQCIADCKDYGKCNYKFVNDYGNGETSLTRYVCSYVDPVTGPAQYKAPEETRYSPALGGGIHTETTYWSIEWQETSGGTCPVPPPAPTVTLTATPTSITSGGTSKLKWTSTNADFCNGTGFSTGGALNNSTGVNVSPTATTDYYITCSNETGSATASARVSVGSTPDLAAGAITPTTATAGQATSFSTTVTNSGTVTTGTGFTVLFQRATTSQGANATDVAAVTTTALAASANRSVSGSVTLPTAGNWYVRACADKRTGGDVNGQITEGNESNNCGSWTLITVAAGATYPNLTASTPTPATAVVGTAKTISSTVTNNGGVTTGAGFTNVIVVNNTQDFTTPIATYTDTSPTLVVGGTDSVSASHTFTSTGTFYIGVCADRNTSGAGAIFESNETDNCAWRQVTVSSTPVGGSELSCTVTKTAAAVGEQVTFTASPDAFTNYTWTVTPSVTGFPDTVRRNTHTFQASAGFYSMEVSGDGTASATCPLVTVGNPCTNPELSITAVPDRVNPGQTTVLTATASGVSGSCQISGPGVSQTVPTNMCNMDDTTITTPAITTQSTYTITCGASSASVVVNVIPKFQEF